MSYLICRLKRGETESRGRSLEEMVSRSKVESNIYDTTSTDSGQYETLPELAIRRQMEGNSIEDSEATYINPCSGKLNQDVEQGISTTNGIVAGDKPMLPIGRRKKVTKWKSLTVKCKKIVISGLVGVVCGVFVSSVMWLTIDKLKETQLVCECKCKEGAVAPTSERPSTLASSETTTTIPTSTTTSGKLSTLTSTPVTNTPTFSTSTITTARENETTWSVTNTITMSGAISTTPPWITDSKDVQESMSTPTTKLEDVTTQPMDTVTPSADWLSTSGEPNTTNSADDKTNGDAVQKRSNDQGGHVYVHWGRADCPSEAEQLYKGFVASGHYQHPGGSTNTICLPEVASWGNYVESLDGDRSLLYNVKYGSSDGAFTTITGSSVKNLGMSCSVCQAVGRNSVVMIPGSTKCLLGWNTEYTGYLMGSAYVHSSAKELICVDSNPQHVTGNDVSSGGGFLYFAEIRNEFSNYVSGRELACVICTQ